jgi:protein-L-isoaspartate(D-aspartate) O-methyltransferase
MYLKTNDAAVYESEKNMVGRTNYSFTVDQCRRIFSDEIRVVAGIDSAELVEAFACVPRENFMGTAPWQISSGISLRGPCYRSTNEIRDLYHDVFIALKASQSLNNGQPSILAKIISALDLTAGKSLLHVGCGTGYYTAIMAEMVGANGMVTACEIDPGLAECATSNLLKYPQVKVLSQDGAADPHASVDAIRDAILINAGVTHLHPAWLANLREGGVLVAPFMVGRASTSKDAIVLRIVRHGQKFTAELVTILSIYPCTGMCDPANQSLLNAAFESHALADVRSLRADVHLRQESCIVHTPQFCLCAESLTPNL